MQSHTGDHRQITSKQKKTQLFGLYMTNTQSSFLYFPKLTGIVIMGR